MQNTLPLYFKLFSLAALTVVASCQQYILAIVSPGPPEVDYNSTNKEFQVHFDRLAANGARQQYNLGLAFVQKYALIFQPEKVTSESIRLVSEYSDRSQMSSQIFARALLSKSKGQNLTNTFMSTLWPPSNHTDPLTNNYSLPEGAALLPTYSFTSQNLLLLASFDKYCPSVAYELSRSLRQYELSSNQLLENIGKDLEIDNTQNFDSIGKIYHFIQSHLHKQGELPPLFKDLLVSKPGLFQRIKRISMLQVLGSISQQNLNTVRLQTKNIYSELSSLVKIIKNKKESDMESLSSIFHLSEKQFIVLLRVLGLTSRECNREKALQNKAEKVDEENDFDCLSYPPYSSSFVFEFINLANQTSNGTKVEPDWRVLISYNGKQINLCGDDKGCTLEDFKFVIKRDLYSTNEDYYCEVNGTNTSADYILLSCMFASIFVFLSSLFCFFSVLTKLKSSEISVKYRQAHAIFNVTATPTDKSASLI